jgi:tRNA modification GTPase
MIEFQVTGSRAVLSGLIRSLGAFEKTRPADAGEFARRAFENGKLDLVEVEGLAAVIDAETSIQLRHALAMTSGQLSQQCENVRSLLIRALADVESLLDFSDIEDVTALSMTHVLSTVEKASSVLGNMIDDSDVSERVRDGLTVVIAGPANVGKSTLFNRLAKREIAIVSPLAGTTRDSLEVALEISGYPVTFIDTAGIREASDPIEVEGIARARRRTANADLALWLFDGNSPSSSLDSERPIIRVRTKVDLPNAEIDNSETIPISALTGFGIDRLIDKIEEFAKFYFAGAGAAVFGTERQRRAVRDVCSSLRRVLDDPHRGVETIAEDLRFAVYGLSRLTGRIEIEEVLGEIFSRLCVGK